MVKCTHLLDGIDIGTTLQQHVGAFLPLLRSCSNMQWGLLTLKISKCKNRKHSGVEYLLTLKISKAQKQKA